MVYSGLDSIPRGMPNSLEAQRRVSRFMPLESMPHGRHQGMVWRVDSTPFPKGMLNSLEGPRSCLSSHATRVEPTWQRHHEMVWRVDSTPIPKGITNSVQNPKSCLSSHANRVHATWKTLRDDVESELDSIPKRNAQLP